MNWKIYKIQNINGKVYIGCTKLALQRRIQLHKYLKKEFVLEEYKLEIIFETNAYNEARIQEALMIQKYNSTDPDKGYNRRFGDYSYGFPNYLQVSIGKNNPMYHKDHSSETKEKIRKKALARDPSTFDNNRIKTPAQLEKLQKGRKKYFDEHGANFLGKHHTDESKKKLSESKKGNTIWLGRKHSEESKEKIRQTKLKNRIILHCNMKNCEKKYKARGYCNTHYRYFLNHGFP